MIFVTTFIFTLILSYVAHAVPACGDAAPPEELYEPYEVTFDAQRILYDVRWDTKYDYPNGDTSNVSCHNLAPLYPHFHNIPHFLLIGAAFDVKWGPSCTKCWNLTNIKTRKSIYLLAIDYTPSGFKLGKRVFDAFMGVGTVGAKVEATLALPRFCLFK